MTETITGTGMSPLEILLVLGAAVLVLARWLPAVARGPVTLAAAATAALSAAVSIVLGLRWQMVPVVAAAAIALGFAAVPLLRQRAGRTVRRAPRWLALPGSAACLALLAVGPVAAWALPEPVFPEPSGQYAVGTTVLEWTDSGRPETFTAEPDDHRSVVVQLWYPAQQSPADVGRAPYMGRTEEEGRLVLAALTSNFGIPGFVLQDVARARTSAVFDAPVVEGAARFPLVLFSPGLTGVRTSNTALAEELASRGYVVVGLDHPYDSAVTVIDGQPIYTRNRATGDDEQDRKAAARNIELRAADLSFVLTQLGRLERGEISGPLTGRLDTARAAAIGHSRGGAAAIWAAHDPRFAAVVNLDGGLSRSAPQPFHQPALALTSPVSVDENPDYIPILSRALELGTATSYRVDVPGTGHFSFGDVALYLPPLPSLVGSVGRAEGLRVTAEATAAFLDSTLAGKPGDLASRLSSYGDLTVYQ